MSLDLTYFPFKIKIRICLMSVLLIASLQVTAQPRVPRVVEFADIKFQLTDEVQRMIQKDVDALHVSFSAFQRRLDKVNLYFPIIERIFEEEGIPEEIKYLVIQESGLIADAVSKSDAVGFWQFKDFTAREVGLRVDNIVDERKNIVSATRGAAKYLKRNNMQFDNWAYAISAYQAGLGGVRRYVEKQHYGAKKMPITKNTHWYLRKFIAHKIAFENEIGGRHSEGIELKEYVKGGGKTLERISKESRIEKDLLQYYNKWILTGSIPEDREYTVILPTQGRLPKNLFEDIPEREEKVISEIKQPDELKFPNELKSGRSSHRNPVSMRINGVKAILAGTSDNIASLAADAGISPKNLILFNDLTSEKIEAGRLYYIEKKKSKSDIGFHVTKRDETLWDISQQYAIKIDKLAKRNRINVVDEITLGQVIWLSGKRPKGTPFEYHDVTSNTISIVQGNIKINESEIPNDQKLQVVKEVRNDTIEEPDDLMDEMVEIALEEKSTLDGKVDKVLPLGKSNHHTVTEGETLWSISKLYNITLDQIRQWNQLTKYDILRIGQRLLISEQQEKTNVGKETVTYIVRGGDTLYQIAAKYRMTVTQLMDLNKKQDSRLSVGEELKVYKQD